MKQYISIPRPVLKTTDSATALQFLLDMGDGGFAYLPYRLIEKYLDTSLYLVEDAPVFHHPIYSISNRLSQMGQELEMISRIIEKNSSPHFADMEEVLNEVIPEDLLQTDGVARNPDPLAGRLAGRDRREVS